MYKLDIITFEKYLNDFLIKYKNETGLVKYFDEPYCNRQQKWAYCLEAQLGANTNMKLERCHRLLKYEEARETVIKRLEKAIPVVLKAVKKIYWKSNSY